MTPLTFPSGVVNHVTGGFRVFMLRRAVAAWEPGRREPPSLRTGFLKDVSRLGGFLPAGEVGIC